VPGCNGGGTLRHVGRDVYHCFGIPLRKQNGFA